MATLDSLQPAEIERIMPRHMIVRVNRYRQEFSGEGQPLLAAMQAVLSAGKEATGLAADIGAGREIGNEREFIHRNAIAASREVAFNRIKSVRFRSE